MEESKGMKGLQGMLKINFQLLITKGIDRFFTFLNQSSNVKRYFLEHQFSDPNYGTAHLDCSDTCILIQGPIIKKHETTLKTIKYYSRVFPNSKIILSSWKEDLSPHFIHKLQELKVDVICNDKPKDTGFLNTNLQLLSTKNGLVKAKSLGFKYTMKTRTDQRIYSENAISFCKGLLDIFPVQSSFLNKRIIGINENTFLFRPFSFSDMFQFGDTDDLLKYWSCTFESSSSEERKNKKQKLLSFYKGELALQEYIKTLYPEVYFFYHFLTKVGLPTSFTLKNYYNALKSLFLVIDSQMIKWHWSKYSAQLDLQVTEEKSLQKRLNFAGWTLIYKNQFYNHDYEKFMKYTMKRHRLTL